MSVDAGSGAGPVSDSGVSSDTGPVSNSGQQEPTGSNPAWQPLMEALPTNLHSIVKPHLDTFDRNFNERLSREQQTYAPYKQFIEGKVDPGMISGALQLMQLIESDPRAFYDKMGSFYAEQWGLGQDPQDSEEDDYALDGVDEGEETYQDPRFDQLKQQQEIIAQVLSAQMEEKRAAAEREAQAKFDSELETQIGAIKQKYGEAFDADALEMALSLALQTNAEDISAVADKVMAFRGQQAGANVPTILPTSGGVPSQAVNAAQLNRKDTRALVAERLKAALGQ